MKTKEIRFFPSPEMLRWLEDQSKKRQISKTNIIKDTLAKEMWTQAAAKTIPGDYK